MTAESQALIGPPPAAAEEPTDLPGVFRGRGAPAGRTLMDILHETAHRSPGAPAVDDGKLVLSYRGLLTEVEKLRRRLAAAGIGLGDRVGVRVASGTSDLYVAILAVLAAGAAYVPVDAEDPDERAALVFSEAGTSAVIGAGLELVPSGTPHGSPGRPGPGDDAWIIFTSGSTGRPKGVAVTHRSAAAFVDAEAALFLADEPMGPGDRVLAGLSVAFDASCEEMWLAWRSGACLVPAPRSLVRTGLDLGPWLVEQEITVVSTVPTLAALWPVEALDEVRLLIFGGEACPPELAERMAVEGREVWNTYGPTEATVVACAAQLTGEGPVRIGLPLDGWELAVVDSRGEVVPMGGVGELVIGGVGLARYLDPAKDAEKYAPLPSLGWSRAYRSGDLVQAEREGLLFLGRADEQIKLGGRRIELGEVDAALQALPGVAGAAAAIRTTPAGHQLLVGYVVAAGPVTGARAEDGPGTGTGTSGPDKAAPPSGPVASGAPAGAGVRNTPPDPGTRGGARSVTESGPVPRTGTPDGPVSTDGPLSGTSTAAGPRDTSSDAVRTGDGAPNGAPSENGTSARNGSGSPNGSTPPGSNGLRNGEVPDNTPPDGDGSPNGGISAAAPGNAAPGSAIPFDTADASRRLREALPAALVPLLAVVDTLPTRTSGKVDRAALPWPLPGPLDAATAGTLTGTEAWLSGLWGDLLGTPASTPDADFFAAGGGSLAAAQLVSRIRTRHPRCSVNDIYQNPRLGALARKLDEYPLGSSVPRTVRPVPRRAAVAQTLLMLPLLTVAGLRWAVAAAAAGNVLAHTGSFPWAPYLSWWWILLGWLVCVSPPGRIAIAAGGARLMLRSLKPGTYARGGGVHLRLWAAERLAELSGATSLSGSWLTHYARALGVRVGADVDLHTLPPVTGMLKLGKGSAVEPEVDLSGHWLDGDHLHVGTIRVGAGATVGARSTLFPGARIGKRAEIAPGSGVSGAVPAGRRWAGVPAVGSGKAAHRWPSVRPPRTRRWAFVYGLTSAGLSLLPVLALLPGLLLIGYAARGAQDGPAALADALVAVPLATVAVLSCYAVLVLAGVRALSIGLREGYHPIHGRIAWQAWATERLMDMARVHLFPFYAGLLTPVWLRALGMKVGRGVEASTVLALPSMTTVGDFAFLADDTMVAPYELGGGWLRIGEARIGKRAFLGNSGMAAGGRSVPKRGLVGVLSAAPKGAKAGSSWLGMPPMKLPRTAGAEDQGRTYRPSGRLVWARAAVELCRIIPVMCAFALAVLVFAGFEWVAVRWGVGTAAAAGGVLLLAGGLIACLLACLAKWLLVGRFRVTERPLWSSFVWRNELADTFVEVLAVPWLAGAVGGTPLMSLWLRSLGARIGRGVWCETYWLPETDLVRIGEGASVNRGCVVQTHLFHDRIMRMDRVVLERGATLGPHAIVLPGTTIGAGATVGPASLVMRGETLPADTRWLGNPITAWQTRQEVSPARDTSGTTRNTARNTKRKTEGPAA